MICYLGRIISGDHLLQVRNLLATFGLILGFTVFTAGAWSPVTPWRHVVTSEDQFFFVMDPGNFDSVPAKGTAHQATRNGTRKLWTVQGWYTLPGEVFLSQDGKTLVRIRDEVASMTSPAQGALEDEEVLFFYRNGKLIRTFKLRELLHDISKETRHNSFGPYGQRWMMESKLGTDRSYFVESRSDGGHAVVEHPDVFQFTTLNGETHLFDLTDGRPLLTLMPRKKESNVQPEANPSDGEDPFAAEK